MHQGKLVFAQLMLYLPLSTFRRCVADHNGEHKVKDFSCLDQFFASKVVFNRLMPLRTISSALRSLGQVTTAPRPDPKATVTATPESARPFAQSVRAFW